MTENTARMGAGGEYIKAKYADIIKPTPVQEQSGEKIAADVIKRAGLRMVKA